MTKKTRIAHLVSLCVLWIGFLLCRFAFFEIHGMKDGPFYLFLFGFMVLGLSFAAKAELVPIVTSLSYIIGFAAGVIFQTEGVDPGGGRSSNLWMIWTGVFVCAVLVSALGEMVKKIPLAKR